LEHGDPLDDVQTVVVISIVGRPRFITKKPKLVYNSFQKVW